MTELPRLIIPRAIYFDANALIAAPQDFATQPIAEVLELAETFRADLFVPQLAVEEWLSKQCNSAVNLMSQVESAAKKLGKMLERAPIEWEAVAHDRIRETVRTAQMKRLESIGFRVLPRPQLELDPIIALFLAKSPPFNDGDKGFKDAIIIETIFSHACVENQFDHVIVVSGDGAFSHTAVRQRFADAGTSLDVIGGDPKNLFTGLSARLESMLSDAGRVLWAEEREAALTFAKRHEKDIFAFVRDNARVSMSQLRGSFPFRLGPRDENDQKLQHARILSINAIRPNSIESADCADHLERMPDDGRVTFFITVSIEIDLTVAMTNYWDEPKAPISDANSLLEATLPWKHPEIEESMVVQRTVEVIGSIAQESVGVTDFRDLRLESV